MITAQDIKNKVFSNPHGKGYNVTEVDAFLDEISGEITSIQSNLDGLIRENAALKDKMKVLVNKIQEDQAHKEDNNKLLNQSLQENAFLLDKMNVLVDEIKRICDDNDDLKKTLNRSLQENADCNNKIKVLKDEIISLRADKECHNQAEYDLSTDYIKYPTFAQVQ